MSKCNHKKNGKSAIIDGVCQVCNIEFGNNYIKKERNKNKRRKK